MITYVLPSSSMPQWSLRSVHFSPRFTQTDVQLCCALAGDNAKDLEVTNWLSKMHWRRCYMGSSGSSFNQIARFRSKRWVSLARKE